MKYNYNLGLDIGIGSIGFALIDNDTSNLIEFGSRIFNSAIEAKDPRTYRSARRTLRRRKWRKEQLKNAFCDFGLLSKEEMSLPNYFMFSTDNDLITKPTVETVYHLRLKALNEKISKREILLCLYNICQNRGHFLLEDVNFEKETIDFELFCEKYYSLTKKYVNYYENLIDFEKDILKPIFNSKMSKNELKKLLKTIRVCDEETKGSLEEIINLLCNYKADLSKIDEQLVLGASKINVNDLKKAEQSTLKDFHQDIINLYDLIKVHNILKDSNYICEIAVKELDKIHELQKLKNENLELYKEKTKYIKYKMKANSGNADSLKVVKNLDNNYPNGLYIKEVTSILKKQQEYYLEDGLTDEFINVCKSIISAKIPYYVGPLSNNAKNSWLIKNGEFKYSYEYSKKSVDEFETIKQWKGMMISRCSYLPEEFAMPKGSLLGEIFAIINELNILTAIDDNDDSYYLTREDKIKIFDNLILKNDRNITYSEISDLLNLKYFGPKNKNVSKKIKNKLSLYHQIIKIIPDCALNSINDIFVDIEKVDFIESIILNINLFDEEKTKREYFTNEEYGYGFDLNTATKLSKLKSTSFYSLSKKFIYDYPMNENGETLIDMLFNDNTNEYTNEQMTLISNARDKDGNRIDFSANKYVNIIENNDGKLNIDLLLEDGKPLIPISRPVIRALNECFKIYEEIVKVYGVPNKVVIETAKDLKDSSVTGEIPAKRFEKNEKLYDYLIKQLKELKLKNELEDYSDIESILKNEDKIELYIRQNGVDIISGKKIDIRNIEKYEIDHILPRGFGDDSIDNKILIHKEINAKKSDRLPLQFLSSEDATIVDNITCSSFEKRVNELFEMKLISEKKKNMLLLETDKELSTFIERNLVDTRYIIREFMAILSAFNRVNDYNTKIVALKSAFTSVFRNSLNIKKNREFGVQHHAHDAAIVVIADRILSTYYPNYDSRDNFKGYKEFIKTIKYDSKQNKTKTFIRCAYERTFNEPYNLSTSLISQVKELVPLYSIKVEKNWKGAFFKETLKKPQNNKTDVLTILGVNNSKRDYDTVFCVAVDFYKYKNKKGKRKHLAVHIPRVIVDEKGIINKEKYCKLIKEHYKVTELFNESGDINTNYFRFRCFVNDVIYDTYAYTPQVYNLGSVVKKQLELKHINIFSYNSIYSISDYYLNSLKNRFSTNCNYQELLKIDKDIIANYLIEELMELDDVDKYRNYIFEKLIKINNLRLLIETAAYYSIVANRKYTYSSIDNQYTPTINNESGVANDEDAYYIKLKYSPLGIRFAYNEKGKLIISGPINHINAFSKIKKEEFSWNLNHLNV